MTGWVPWVAVVGVLLGGGLAACTPGEDEASTVAGFGLPTQSVGEPLPGERQDVRGTFHVEDDGCFTLEIDGERRWAVWPSGAEHAGDAVDLGDATVTEGDTVVGTGAVVDADALPGFEDGSTYFGSFGRFCRADQLGVVVLDAVDLG